MTLLSLSQAWFPACTLSAICGGIRASRRGYNPWIYASLGLLLGPGALPVVWLVTRLDLSPQSDGTGFIKTTNPLEVPPELRRWERFDHSWRQFQLGMLPGVVGGCLLNLSQNLTHLLPAIFEETPEEYERGGHAGALIEMKIRILWVFIAVLSPSLFYWVMNRWLRPAVFDRLWILYAYRAAGPNWRELVPENLRHLPDPPTEDPDPVKRQLEEWILNWSVRMVPILLILFLGTLLLLVHFGYQAYDYLGNKG